MDSLQDMMDAEREAYASGDFEKSDLLKQCISIAESNGDAAVEDYESMLSDKLARGNVMLNDLKVRINDIIEVLEE